MMVAVVVVVVVAVVVVVVAVAVIVCCCGRVKKERLFLWSLISKFLSVLNTIPGEGMVYVKF